MPESVKLKSSDIPKDRLSQEDVYLSAGSTTTGTSKKIGNILGNPTFTAVTEIEDGSMKQALQLALQLLESNSFTIDFLATYPDHLKYQFITTELMEYEVDTAFLMPGMNCNFIYEEFHPNNAYDIEQQVKQFIESWSAQKVAPILNLLAPTVYDLRDQPVAQHAVVLSIQHFFDLFTAIEHCRYQIDTVKYHFNEIADKGTGSVEGYYSCRAIKKDGDSREFEGPFNFRLTREAHFWDIDLFQMPGYDNLEM